MNVKTESPQNWSAGTTSGDFCIAPDPRELFIPNGVGSRGKGKGKGNGAGDGANVFIPRSLSVSELSGTGTCSGDLEFEDEDLDTWEELLAVIDLQVAQPGSRGAVDAFGEFLNVEGNTMIVETAQCNRSRSLTRRTTHVFPVRLSGPGAASGKENENIRTQLDGIEGTLGEAAVCADASLIADMQLSLDAARLAFAQKRYEDAIEDLEEVARSAKNAETFGTGFMNCPIDSNYRGNFMPRGLSAAFTVHDRFLHADAYVKYFIPADLEVPLLDPTP